MPTLEQILDYIAERKALAQPPAAPPQTNPETPTTYEEVEEAMRCLPAHFGPNSYDTWLAVLMAVHSALGDAGIPLCERYVPGHDGEIAAKFAGFDPHHGRTVATLFDIAKRYGYQPRRSGSEPASAGAKQPPELSDAEIVAVLDESHDASRIAFHSAWPYGIENDTLVRYFETKDGGINTQVIAHFYATIHEEVTDEDGTKTFVLRGKAARGGPFDLEIDAATFGHDTRLRAALEAAAGARDPVRPDMTKHIGPAIKLLTNDVELSQIRRFHRTGWHHKRFLLPGREDAHVQIDLPQKLPFQTGTADPDTARAALAHLLAVVDPTLTTPIVAMLLQAPLHRLAGWHNERYAIFVQGRTGSLKTSFCQAAMCLYGPDFIHNDNLIKWGEGATRNAIMAFATRAHDMPLLIDNYKPNTGGGDRDFINLIHNILEGGEKDRLSRSSELKETKRVHCFPLITGEDTPASDAASLARVLVVKFAWQHGQANDHLTEAQIHNTALAAIGEAWISWLESEDAQTTIAAFAAELPKQRMVWAEHLRRQRPDMVNVLRVATSLAVNTLTWRSACRHPLFGDLLQMFDFSHLEGLKTIAQTMANHTAEALPAHRYIDAVRELLTTGQCIVVQRALGQPTDADRDRMIGWRDSDGVYLLPRVSLHAVKRLLGPGELAESPQTLYAQLDALGLLAGKTDRQPTRVVKIWGKSERVLHLKPNVFDAPNKEDDLEL